MQEARRGKKLFWLEDTDCIGCTPARYFFLPLPTVAPPIKFLRNETASAVATCGSLADGHVG